MQIIKLNRIKLTLVEKGVTQTAVANHIGISRPTINSYCQNKRQPTLDTIYKISEYLNIPMKDLISDLNSSMFYIKK